MKKIGLLSDTHAHWDEKYKQYFSDCDEIWHAGDIGNDDVFSKLSTFKTLRAVHGNIDDHSLRTYCPKILRFKVEDVKVFMTHIGGYPGKYDRGIKEELFSNTPDLFICGHSHILKVMYDHSLKMLYMNPGAAGKYGNHKVRTLLRFIIDGKNIKSLEVIEII